MDIPVCQDGSQFLDGDGPSASDRGEPLSTSPPAQDEREQRIAFADSHRDSAERSGLFLEALAGQVAIAASCLAIGRPSALLPQEVWQAGGAVQVLDANNRRVNYSNDALAEARCEWGSWYRFLTSSDLALRDCLRISERPWRSKDILSKRHKSGESEVVDSRYTLTAILLGIALEAETYAAKNATPFYSNTGACPVLSAGSFVRIEKCYAGRILEARLNSDFLLFLTRLRRWDPTGRRSRAAAIKHFHPSP